MDREDGRQEAEYGFPAHRDVRLAAVLTSISMLIASYTVIFVFYHRYSFVSSEFLAKRKN